MRRILLSLSSSSSRFFNFPLPSLSPAKTMGFTQRLIASEADFKKFGVKYQIVMVATLFCLFRFVFLSGEYEILDFSTFEISKVSFRWMMGVLAGMMASTYFMSLCVRAYYEVIGSTERIYEEMAIFYGSLTLLFFSVNLFGVWGIVCLPVSPPIILLGLQLAKGKAAKIQHTD